MYGRPFEKAEKITVFFPCDLHGLAEGERKKLAGIPRLCKMNEKALERELGAGLSFCQPREEGEGARWYIGPARCNPHLASLDLEVPTGPEIYLDREELLLVTTGTRPDEVIETFSYLRSLAGFKGGRWKIDDCPSLSEAITCIKSEISHTYPSFALRGKNWEKICRRHIARVKEAENPVAALQAWVAELEDAHTGIQPYPRWSELPYQLYVKEGKGRFYKIEKGSPAWNLGVKKGYELLDKDFDRWWQRTSASPHSKPLVVGKRILSAPRGEMVEMKARSPEGKIITWEEESPHQLWKNLVRWEKIDSRTGYLQIKAWVVGKGLEESIDEAFTAFKDCEKLIVDLRGNPGGNIHLAHNFRNRFLKEEGVVGWIQHTLPDGSLSELDPLVGRPSTPSKRWEGRALFLTDPLTYSASEDVLLGLQGQPHIQVIGQRSGGGSGRLRIIRLLPGYRLTISTALTYNIQGRCIEGRGVAVDVEVPFDLEEGRDRVLEVAREV